MIKKHFLQAKIVFMWVEMFLLTKKFCMWCLGQGSKTKIKAEQIIRQNKLVAA